MAKIKKVTITDYNDGCRNIIVWYGNDRAKMFSDIPKTVEKYVKTAKNKNTHTCPISTITEYTD